MSDSDFTRALGYASSAIDLLKRSGIPPYPHYFELLYTYVTGINPKLNARINVMLKAGGAPSVELAEQLYHEFLVADDANERISSVSERMQDSIAAVNAAIQTAMTTASSYTGSLEAVKFDLDGDMTADQLKNMAVRLLDETRRMQENNADLEVKLKASQDDIAALQDDLEEVRREAMLDPLTKIANRKAFDQGLRKALQEAGVNGLPLSLVMIDVDYFKRFNDTYGHQTGDQVLRLLAMTLNANIKGRDMAARFGGEEFAAILPSTTLADAVVVAENIRKAIQAKELLKRSTNEKLGRLTASFGVASYHEGDSVASLVERADQCLYAAKALGRNRTVSELELGNAMDAA